MKNEMNRRFPVHLSCLVFCTLVYSRLNIVRNNIQHLFNRPLMNTCRVIGRQLDFHPQSSGGYRFKA